MNYHSNEWVMEQIHRHYEHALTIYDKEQIVGVFCQGSTNYGLDTELSDIDTKCILVPSFKDIAMNKKPVSTTNVLPNNEHLDAKDIRLYMNTFEKQNLNFLEILFTPYEILNPKFQKEWSRLVAAREKIARMNPYRAVKSMYGIAMEKYHAMCHPYPSKLDILAKLGYDPKQLHHLLRVEEYLERYIDGEMYAACLRPRNPGYLVAVKLGLYSLDEAKSIADLAKAHIEAMTANFCEKTENATNQEALDLLDDVQYNIMLLAVKGEIGNV